VSDCYCTCRFWNLKEKRVCGQKGNVGFAALHQEKGLERLYFGPFEFMLLFGVGSFVYLKDKRMPGVDDQFESQYVDTLGILQCTPELRHVAACSGPCHACLWTHKGL
jgi:hypothetical protein